MPPVVRSGHRIRVAGLRGFVTSGDTDAQLLHAAGEDPAAFAVFYERYEALVVAYFVRRVRDPELIADLTAEVFAAVLGATSRYRASEPTAANWLFTIAHNTLAKSLRKGKVEARARRRLGIRDAVSLHAEELDRVDALASSDSALEDLLERLPAEQAVAIRARVVDERDYSEIAAELRTSELVIRKRVSRGLAALRQEAQKENP
jgi:RNA polymerase sigma factor (sigma-70 family)